MLVTTQGFRKASRILKRRSEVAVRPEKIGTQLDRAPEIALRQFIPAGLGNRDAQAVVRIGRIGPQLQGVPEALDFDFGSSSFFAAEILMSATLSLSTSANP